MDEKPNALAAALLTGAAAGSGVPILKLPAGHHNARHGKAGILERIRSAKTPEAIDALLVEVHSSGASAKTIRKAVRAAELARERVGFAGGREA